MKSCPAQRMVIFLSTETKQLPTIMVATARAIPSPQTQSRLRVLALSGVMGRAVILHHYRPIASLDVNADLPTIQAMSRLGILLLLLGCSLARAQPPATQPDDRVRVYLVTIGQGAEVWEKFGHNMIWIHDPQARPGAVDAAYN